VLAVFSAWNKGNCMRVEKIDAKVICKRVEIKKQNKLL
jgi:hypothetical protein